MISLAKEAMDLLRSSRSHSSKTIASRCDIPLKLRAFLRIDSISGLLDLFSNPKDESNDEKITDVMNKIKEKYGKNAILRGTSLMDGATQKERNKLIGGHNAE